MINTSTLINQKRISVSELVFLGICFVVSFLLSYAFSFDRILIIICSIALIYLIFKIPEIGFALFLLIGVLKNITEHLPFDFTIILFSLTSLSLIFQLSKKKMTLNIANKYFVIMIGFACWVIVGLFFSEAPHAGLLKTTRFIVFNMFLFIGGLSIGSSSNHPQKFVKVIFILLFIYGLIYLYFFKDVIGMNLREFADYHLRFTLVGNPIGVGRIFSVLVLISLIYFFKNYSPRLLYIFTFFIGLIITLVANSRGPLVALILTIFVYLLAFSGIKKKQIFAILLALVIIFSSIILLLPKNFVSRYSFGLSKEIHVSEKQIKVFSTSQEREIFFNQAITYLSEHPEKLIFGIGTGSFSYLSKNADTRLYPHNIFIEIILEFGIIGFLLFILPFFFLFLDFIRYRNELKDQRLYSMFALWIIFTILFFINSQFSGDINDNRLMWFFQGGAIGIILSATKGTIPIGIRSQ